MDAQNSSQHPYEAYLIAGLSSSVQHQIFKQSLHTHGTSFSSSAFAFLFICHHVLLS